MGLKKVRKEGRKPWEPTLFAGCASVNILISFPLTSSTIKGPFSTCSLFHLRPLFRFFSRFLYLKLLFTKKGVEIVSRVTY